MFCTVQANLIREYNTARLSVGISHYDGSSGGIMTASLGPLYMGNLRDGNWTFQPNGTAIIGIHPENSGAPLTLLGGGGVSLGLYKILSPTIISQLLWGMRDEHFVWGGRAGLRLTVAELGGFEIVWQQLKSTPEIQVLFTIDLGAIRNVFF